MPGVGMARACRSDASKKEKGERHEKNAKVFEPDFSPPNYTKRFFFIVLPTLHLARRGRASPRRRVEHVELRAVAQRIVHLVLQKLFAPQKRAA